MIKRIFIALSEKFEDGPERVELGVTFDPDEARRISNDDYLLLSPKNRERWVNTVEYVDVDCRECETADEAYGRFTLEEEKEYLEMDIDKALEELMDMDLDELEELLDRKEVI